MIKCAHIHTYTDIHMHMHTDMYTVPFGTRPWLRSSYDLSTYSWKSFFTATSGKNTPQYRMMLEYASSLEDALADVTNLDVLTVELTIVGLITDDQMKHVLLGIHDAKVKAASILIGLVTIKVYSNSENFTTFLDVLKKHEAKYGHTGILAKIKDSEKGLFVIIVCTASNFNTNAIFHSP